MVLWLPESCYAVAREFCVVAFSLKSKELVSFYDILFSRNGSRMSIQLFYCQVGESCRNVPA